MAKDDASENMVLRTVYLPKALDKQLRAIAFEVELSKGELMRVLIAEAMQHRASKGEAAFERGGAAAPRPVIIASPPPPPPSPPPAPVQPAAEPPKAAKPRAPKPAPEPKAPDASQSSIFDFL